MDYNFEAVFFISSRYLLFAIQGRNLSTACVSTKIFVILFPFLAFYPLFAKLTLSYKLCEFLRDTFSSLITLTKVSNIFDIPCKEL